MNSSLIEVLATIRSAGNINMLDKSGIVRFLLRMADMYNSDHYENLANGVSKMNGTEWMGTLHRMGEFTVTCRKLQEDEANQEPPTSIFD